MASSGKTWFIVVLSSWALRRSLPNGFSTMTRAPSASPQVAMPLAMRPKSGGGTSR